MVRALPGMLGVETRTFWLTVALVALVLALVITALVLTADHSGHVSHIVAKWEIDLDDGGHGHGHGHNWGD